MQLKNEYIFISKIRECRKQYIKKNKIIDFEVWKFICTFDINKCFQEIHIFLNMYQMVFLLYLDATNHEKKSKRKFMSGLKHFVQTQLPRMCHQLYAVVQIYPGADYT